MQLGSRYWFHPLVSCDAKAVEMIAHDARPFLTITSVRLLSAVSARMTWRPLCAAKADAGPDVLVQMESTENVSDLRLGDEMRVERGHAQVRVPGGFLDLHH